jgi:hypothetical protein
VRALTTVGNARQLSEEMSESPTISFQTAVSSYAALLSSIIWHEFCSIVVLARPVQRFAVWKVKDAAKGLGAPREQSNK